MDIIEANNNVADLLKNCEVPVILDFWAPWCGPCQQLNPELKSLGEVFSGRLQVIKVNVDKHEDLLGEYKIRSIPTLLFVGMDKEVVEKVVGYRTLEDLKKIVQTCLKIAP